MNHTSYTRFGKRVVDLLGAIVGLLVLTPFFAVIAVLVKATSRGPIFFQQIRVGQFERPFRIFKFRSMRGSALGRGSLLTAAGDPRITRVGRWLRKSKMDELPQLINVLLGQMSLVGPRPEVPEYTAAYSLEQRRVFQQKPGITSPAAIHNVREEELLTCHSDKHDFYLSILLPRKLEMDLEYCANISLIEDMKCILATIGCIFVDAKTPQTLSVPVPESKVRVSESSPIQ